MSIFLYVALRQDVIKMNNTSTFLFLLVQGRETLKPDGVAKTTLHMTFIYSLALYTRGTTILRAQRHVMRCLRKPSSGQRRPI